MTGEATWKRLEVAMMERQYQPGLIGPIAIAKARDKYPTHFAHYYRIEFFLKDRAGMYFITGTNPSKLYMDEDPSDGHFGNCPQDSLWTERENLAEVIVYGTEKDRKAPVVFKSFAEFLEDLDIQWKKEQEE